eukprot:3201815-Ditylum_brightwellii.AAC.1
MKRVVILFPRPAPGSLNVASSTPTSYAPLQQTQLHPSTTSLYLSFSVPFFDWGPPEEWIKFRRGLSAVLKGQNVTQGPPSYAVANTLLKGDTLMVFEQAEIAVQPLRIPTYV